MHSLLSDRSRPTSIKCLDMRENHFAITCHVILHDCLALPEKHTIATVLSRRTPIHNQRLSVVNCTNKDTTCSYHGNAASHTWYIRWWIRFNVKLCYVVPILQFVAKFTSQIFLSLLMLSDVTALLYFVHHFCQRWFTFNDYPSFREWVCPQ